MNYTVFYRTTGTGSFHEFVQIENVAHDQTLSPLKPDALYQLFVKAVNVKGENDSPVIKVITKPTRK